MPFRATFDCLWCGVAHVTRGPDDLEGFAQLCPECIGRAQENGFLRYRVKAALAERAAATAPEGAPARAAALTLIPPAPGPTDEAERSPKQSVSAADDMVAYYTARAPEYDDWYLRRGRYARGPVKDMAWHVELDAATRWLDSLGLHGEIVELAAGTGWWSPLLAQKGELSAYDLAGPALDRARDRLLAHGLRAHLHERDAWAEPDRQVDGLFTGFWLSHVPRERLAEFLSLAHRWLQPGGIYAFIDSLPDPESGALDHPAPPAADVSIRRLADGREFLIPKIYYSPGEFEAALVEAGFAEASVETTGRFFLLGRATA